MPYNNTPIQPPKEYTGAVSLPLARVKKIVHADDEIQNCSNNAAFVITIATEMFIQHLVEKTHEIVKAEKRPRRNVQYGDVANAVARLDNLEFLSDVVPRTTTYSKYQIQQKRKAENEAKAALQENMRSPKQPSEITTPLMPQPAHLPVSSPFTNGGPFVNGHAQQQPPPILPHPQLPQPHAYSQQYEQQQPQQPLNPSGFNPGAFAGPSGARVYFDNNDQPEPMQVDRPSSRPGQVPNTMDMLERARAAQARAGSSISSHTHSPSLPPFPTPSTLPEHNDGNSSPSQ